MYAYVYLRGYLNVKYTLNFCIKRKNIIYNKKPFVNTYNLLKYLTFNIKLIFR